MTKLLKVSGKVIFVVWGLYAFLIVLVSLFSDVSAVINGTIKIQNWLWYLGFVPPLFFASLLFTQLIKSDLLKKFTGLLALASFLILMAVQFSGFSFQYTITALFMLTIFIKNQFILRKKAESTLNTNSKPPQK